MTPDASTALPRVQRTNVRRLYEQAIAVGDDALLRRVQDYLVGQGWIGGAPGQLNIEEAIAAVEGMKPVASTFRERLSRERRRR